MSLNMFDYGLLVVILLSLLLGVRRGFFAEVLSVLTWVIAFFVAMLFTHSLALYLAHYVKSTLLANLLSFVGLFVLVLIIGAIVRCIVMRLTDQTQMSIVNRMLGAVFGIARGVLVALLLVFIFSNTALKDHDWFKNAALTNELQGINHWIHTKASTVDWQQQATKIVDQA